MMGLSKKLVKNIFRITLCSALVIGCTTKSQTKSKMITTNKPAKVELISESGKFKLLVDKKPFYIKGAGLEFGKIKSVAKHGGNSFRTWRTENGKQSGKEVLDEALKNGLMVTMGIEVARERHGFDYDNEVAVKEQLERIRQEVIALKNHPALLMWGIGNELNLRYTNPKVWDAVNDISKMIHKEDPNHLTTTMLAGISKKEVDFIKERSSDLDLLCFQIYGDLLKLPTLVKESGWKGAYIVTEWGATGHWEVPKTSWGVSIEENSTVKAANYLARYNGGIAADPNQCIGSYVFLWGQKQERTPTWYGIFLEDGSETESVDVMHYVWNNNTWPENRAPQIQSFQLNNKTAYDNVILKLNEECVVNFKVKNLENEELNYSWEILNESTDLKDGGDYEKRPKAVPFEIINSIEGNLVFKAPNNKGAYRLFAYVKDSDNNTATANIPFKVN
ncbi:glycoside hydrolase family 2 TIM barrel-domain containing protein [Lutibacter sp. TH_r2]|uniref:glycoside hydrolase family 2 TIM barrel-domain containing protein n=1 Tax=Lutibacter sp. TH_r2 TaxID=3082083 RepID=UPI0029554605|nr:glycoside hydrolase family 2 TIM barrel-domain containing protein [Lutibacter sp. TH_r2]MDV7186050.1 glycoside hydrolase family 2 TIM barrel-domain containing protein [Lutibacter sp. TH_r2]